MDFSLKTISSLDKIFLSKQMCNREETPVVSASVLKGEKYSYQVMINGDNTPPEWTQNFRFRAEVTENNAACIKVSVREVAHAPSGFPCYPDKSPDAYLTTQSGLYPDILREETTMKVVRNTSRTLWVTVETQDSTPTGDYTVRVTVQCEESKEEQYVDFSIHVIDAVLPEQTLKYTQWFHTDCIADVYHLPVFSEEHWERIAQFVKMAHDTGINMILTPVFTPPLDTDIGGERTTVQLVDVTCTENGYLFGFDKLRRWIRLCKGYGIKYFEISHLFTQWGAEHAPKIMANVNGEEKRIFGWETDLKQPAYKEFLEAFLPQLITVLKEEGVDKHTVFHVSDEPHGEQIVSYRYAKSLIAPLLKDFVIMDALSDHAFFSQGVTEHPIPAVYDIEPFLENPPQELWTYYCCLDDEKSINRGFAHPSAKVRMAGMLFYKYHVEGFLHWGYNFYNSCKSLKHINPYAVTDADFSFPSGDSFSVYPGENGPEESLRAAVFYEGIEDMRALQKLEACTSREYALSVLEADGSVSWKDYPLDNCRIIAIRERINREIEKHITA